MNYRITGLLAYCLRQLHVFRIAFSASVGEQRDGEEYERASGAACRRLREVCIYFERVEPGAVVVFLFSQVAAYVLLLVPMMPLTARKHLSTALISPQPPPPPPQTPG